MTGDADEGEHGHSARQAQGLTGAFNLLVSEVCRDEEASYEFLTSRVGSLRSVDRVETSPIIRTLKQSSSVLAPAVT